MRQTGAYTGLPILNSCNSLNSLFFAFFALFCGYSILRTQSG